MKSLLFIFGIAVVAHAAPVELPLWPAGKIPKYDLPEKVTERSKDPSKPNRSVTNVSEPTIMVYQPASTGSPSAAVVICPGGGYGGLAIDKEGHAVARWLNKLGVAGIVLKYRVPTRPGDGKHLLPLQDAQRALGVVRAHAKEWNLDPQRIGIMGFSAGGHLTANLSNNFEPRAYEPVDDADRLSCRPDFAILIYPAYLTSGTTLSTELKVTTNTPPSFMVQTEDDKIRVENVLFYYLALKNAKVPAELHVYATGGHGYGLGVNGGEVATWPQRCATWLKEMKIAP